MATGHGGAGAAPLSVSYTWSSVLERELYPHGWVEAHLARIGANEMSKLSVCRSMLRVVDASSSMHGLRETDFEWALTS